MNDDIVAQLRDMFYPDQIEWATPGDIRVGHLPTVRA